MSNAGVDYPTTGGWGQTNKQWKDQKTSYERLIERRDALKNIVNRIEQKREANSLVLDTISEYCAIYGSDLSDRDAVAFERQRSYIQEKYDFLTVALNEKRNALKTSETDVVNGKRSR
jgi:hypothetical protein